MLVRQPIYQVLPSVRHHTPRAPRALSITHGHGVARLQARDLATRTRRGGHALHLVVTEGVAVRTHHIAQG
jgi:hypothetical protein